MSSVDNYFHGFQQEFSRSFPSTPVKQANSALSLRSASAPASLANAANAVRTNGNPSTFSTPRLSHNFLLGEKNTNDKFR